MHPAHPHMRAQAPKLSAAQVASSRKNKKGNPFEFLSLLQSLTTRW